MGIRSKTAAAWLALLGGAWGAHWFYLKGVQSLTGWIRVPPLLLGLLGVQMCLDGPADQPLAWGLIAMLGLLLSCGALEAILIGLTPDERWAKQWHQAPHATHWGPILAVISALVIGATVLMSTLAYAGQRFFEWQLARPVATPAHSIQSN